MDESITLTLNESGYWGDCPTWFQNVVIYLENTGKFSSSQDRGATIFQFFNHTYGAYYVGHDYLTKTPGKVTFPHQHVATECLLTWS
jgi:hypothetical protein